MVSLTSLVSHWALDEASGTRNDAHGTNHLTDNNTVTSATGVVGNAGDFERNNSEYLSLASNSTVQMGDIDFTICAWVNLESTPALDWSIVAKSDSSNGDYFLQYRESGTNRFRFAVYGGAGFTSEGVAVATTLGLPSLSTWYFVVGWHDSVANTVNIQVNNGTVDSASYSGGVRAGTETFYVSSAAFGQYWDGLIDEVSLWKRTLTTQERTDLYNGGAGLAYPFSVATAAAPPPLFLPPAYYHQHLLGR